MLAALIADTFPSCVDCWPALPPLCLPSPLHAPFSPSLSFSPFLSRLCSLRTFAFRFSAPRQALPEDHVSGPVRVILGAAGNCQAPSALRAGLTQLSPDSPANTSSLSQHTPRDAADVITGGGERHNTNTARWHNTTQHTEGKTQHN